jgi:hypothetical protein
LGPWATANYCRAGIKSLRGTSVDHFFYVAANWDWTEDQAEMQAFIQAIKRFFLLTLYFSKLSPCSHETLVLFCTRNLKVQLQQQERQQEEPPER